MVKEMRLNHFKEDCTYNKSLIKILENLLENPGVWQGQEKNLSRAVPALNLIASRPPALIFPWWSGAAAAPAQMFQESHPRFCWISDLKAQRPHMSQYFLHNYSFCWMMIQKPRQPADWILKNNDNIKSSRYDDKISERFQDASSRWQPDLRTCTLSALTGGGAWFRCNRKNLISDTWTKIVNYANNFNQQPYFPRTLAITRRPDFQSSRCE